MSDVNGSCPKTPFWQRRERKRRPRPDKQAEAIKEILVSLYPPKEDFTLELNHTRKPKTRMGVYSPAYRHIIIYTRWGFMMAVALHEYAHHIFETEQRTNRKERSHGKRFKAVLKMLEQRYWERNNRP